MGGASRFANEWIEKWCIQQTKKYEVWTYIHFNESLYDIKTYNTSVLLKLIVWMLHCFSIDDQIAHNSTTALPNRDLRMGIGVVIILSMLVVTILCGVAISKLMKDAAQNLHNAMFRRLLRAPITFFERNSVGKIIFSSLYFIHENIMKPLLKWRTKSLICFSSRLATIFA